MVKHPNIRFAGFADDWVKRKLGELAKVQGGNAWSSSDYIEEGQYLVITISNVTGNEYVNDSSGNYIDCINPGIYELLENDILVSLTGNVGRVSKMTKTRAVLNQRVARVSTGDEVDGAFIFHILSKSEFESQMAHVGQGAAQMNISNKDIIDYDITTPTLKEQQKIGSIFSTLDHKIGLEERQISLLKDLKKGYLQKMFPKNGAKVPELRFAGFADDWEERKLGELASFSKGNGYTKKDLVEFGDPIILYGRLYTKYETVIEKVDTFVNKKDKSIISEGSEVIVPASGESSEDISRASVVGKSGIILGGDLNIIKPVNYIDSIFLALTISNGSQQKEMSKRAQGKSVVHLHNSDLKQVNILYPKLEEQNKIGSFFKQLDNTIALHQRKLDLLKALKKGLLQQMFV